jgi:glutamate racemase
MVMEALKPLQSSGIDTLILGCTHYPLLMDSIGKAMGKEVAIISSAEETAAELSTILQHQNLLAKGGTPKHRFFTTGSAETFAKIAEEWFGHPVFVDTVELRPLQKETL